MQTGSKFAMFFFLSICNLMGKRLNNLGEFNFIYKSFNTFYASEVGRKVTGTDSIQSQISSKTSRGKMDSTK